MLCLEDIITKQNMKDELPQLNLNLAIVGAKGCGKSAITVRFLTKRFIGEYLSTSDVCIDREIDIAGQIANVHVKDTNACDWLKGPSALLGWSTALAIVYSVTDTKSFELATYILDKLNVTNRMEPNSILLLGNKSDLSHHRKVSYGDGKQLALQHGLHFHETSASSDCDGVTFAFERLLFSALSTQQSKIQCNNYAEHMYSSTVATTTARKTNRVVRDYNRDYRTTRNLRAMSTGSHESSSTDTMSIVSEEDDGYHTTYSESSHLSVVSTPEASPSTSPIPSVGRRKMSLPVLLEKIGFNAHARKTSHVSKLR